LWDFVNDDFGAKYKIQIPTPEKDILYSFLFFTKLLLRLIHCTYFFFFFFFCLFVLFKAISLLFLEICAFLFMSKPADNVSNSYTSHFVFAQNVYVWYGIVNFTFVLSPIHKNSFEVLRRLIVG